MILFKNFYRNGAQIVALTATKRFACLKVWTYAIILKIKQEMQAKVIYPLIVR